MVWNLALQMPSLMWKKNRMERRCRKLTWKNDILQYTERLAYVEQTFGYIRKATRKFVKSVL